jgi:NAD(P)-dependent dehydrogenase (short-subunit alcohol dehydrogenase family)
LSGKFSFDLTGRTVLVTGASSGLGHHFALVLAASGAKVVIGARRLALLNELKAQIEAKGGQALALVMDTTDEASVKAAYDQAEATFGGVDSVVANAGMNLPGTGLSLSAEDFDKITAVNLRGVFLTVREAARRMIKAGAAERCHGRIVIISSITAHYLYSGVPAYSATKAGISHLGRVFARDWATKGININTISPGYMETELTGDLWEGEFGKKLLARFPRNRIMKTDALDAMLLYLCSDASGAVTGSEFMIDDGQTLN